jgi:hypothetical protein
MPLPLFGQHEFRKARMSDPHKDCVCVARRDGWVEIRDDKTEFDSADDHRLCFTEPQFDTYLAAIKTDDHHAETCITITISEDPTIFTMRSTVPQSGSTDQLLFTKSEIDAFIDRVHNNEFSTLALT